MEGLNSDNTETQLKSMEHNEASFDSNKQNEATVETSSWDDTCRVCANARDHMIPIFENEGAEHDLSNKIHMYLPIEVSKTDGLPLKLCYHCAATLLAWHELVTGCLDAEKRLLQMQTQIEQKEPSDLKHPIISSSDELVEEMITGSEESAENYSLTTTEKLQKPNLPLPSHENQEKEVTQLKCIVKLDSNEVGEETVAASNLIEVSEPIVTHELELSYIAQNKDESSLIREQEELCATQQLEQSSENVEQCTVSQETEERSARAKKPFKLLIDAQSICRKGEKTKIEITEKISVMKDNVDSMWNRTLYPGVEDRLSRLESPSVADDGLSSAEDTLTRLEETRQQDTNERLAMHKRVLAEKSQVRQDDDESNPNDDCASIRVKCNVCSREFSDPKDLQIHTKDHRDLPEAGKIYQCVECNKNFRLKDSLVRHLRIHRDERPFTCHVCGKQFRDSGGLSRHLKDVHAKLKNFSCDICGNSFSSKATRDDHRRTHTGERPYVCNTCNKSFKSKACLYSHNKLHTNEFPHPCPYCNKKFRRRQEMLAHATTHTGEKNYSCDVCFMRFRVKTEVARHKLTHSEEKPFVCAKCGLRFRQNRYLNNHIKSRHV